MPSIRYESQIYPQDWSPTLTASDAILRRYGRHCHRSHRRTRTAPPGHGIYLLLGNSRLLPHRLLGVERWGLGLQVRSHGLRWWRACRNRLRHVGSRVLNGPGPTAGEDDVEFPAAQCVVGSARHHSVVVWMVGIQRRKLLWGESEGHYGLLELQSYRNVCRRYVGATRLEACAEVVHGWLVFRVYLGSGGCHASIWLHYSLG
jgi:hypothetical protein